ncbi:MAG: 4Fe-4S dicluster domain-containing protein, partial [Bacteroidota bacterium]
KGGQVGGVIFFNSNPVYDHPRGAEIKAAISNAAVSVSTSISPDETSEGVTYIAPDHHYLESWGDASPKAGHYSLAQPTISPIYNTRQAQESFLTWAGNSTKMYDYVRTYWRSNMFDAANALDFDMWFDKMLHDGIFEMSSEVVELTYTDDTAAAAAGIGRNYSKDNAGVELALYQKAAIGTGAQANNPWLQEMPDPISKATWDNYVTISQAMANEMGIKLWEGKTETVNLTVNGVTMEIPAMVQPGQARGTVGLAIGYGRTKAGKVAEGLGTDAYPLMGMLNGTCTMDITQGVSVEATGNQYQLAQTQTHQTFMGRTNVIQEATLAEYKADPFAGYEGMEIHTSEGVKEPYAISLWGSGHEYKNHHWGMAIDMNTCTGCGACTVACQTENNIPVVGKQEVVNRREMHWLRIDRYYSSDAGPASNGFDIDGQAALEIASDNPQVTFQPMMCQQCNNAPCETVCPVAATTHSTEGLNQMTYNRCIGTRYCANNCPYKVRRFNWFKYHDNKQFADVNTPANDDLGKMVLNPDVTVRSRGVMEKCTFCVQRIQLGKLEAKKEGRRPKDGDVVAACAAACASGAIIFGDMKDPESQISQVLGITNSDDPEVDKVVTNPRAYHVLEEIRVHPNVFYLRKVRNNEGKPETAEA